MALHAPPFPVPRRLITVEEYHRMAKAGILGEDDRVELLEGEIVRMNPIGGPHASCVNRLVRAFRRRLPLEVILSVQNPVRLSPLSEPEPDIALLRERPELYTGTLPGPEDVLLLIEVADTSVDLDRRLKLPLYARAGIPEVWLIDLATDTVEVFREPSAEGYKRVERIGRDARLTAGALPALSLAVPEVLG